MQQGQSEMANTRARGAIAVCMMMFGVFLLFPGVTLTAVGNSSHDEFFESSHRPMRIIGPFLLSLGLALVFTSCCFCYANYRRDQELRRQRGNQPVQTGPVVSGYTPVASQNTYPVGQQYPQSYQSNTQPGAYPTGSGYQYSTQTTAQQPYNQYGAPPASNPTYPAMGSPNYPATTAGTSPSAPPPSSDTVVDSKPYS